MEWKIRIACGKENKDWRKEQRKDLNKKIWIG